MKSRILITLLLLMLASIWVFGQRPFEKQPIPYFGVRMADAVTCSGHGYSLNMGAYLEKGKKSLQFGTIYEYSDHKITGGEVIYKHLLFHRIKSDDIARGKRWIPYVKYNFIYRNSTPTSPNIPSKPLKSMTTGEVPSTSPGRISSIEHFVGGGLQVRMMGNLYLDTSVAFGGYLGSINKESKEVAQIGVHQSNSGYGFAGELGITYKFGR